MTSLPIHDPANPALAGAADDAAPLRAQALGVRLGERCVLRDVSLCLAPRRICALLGANGAGKSTLLAAVATLVPLSHGKLWLFGRPATRNSTGLRARIGLIGHQTMLYRDLTALENLVFFGRLYGLARPAVRAAQLLQRVGLADRAHDAVKTFSRGMGQRLAIARALMHDPQLLLADEPFSGLDLASIDICTRLLDELRREGKAILVTHHDIGHALELADEFAVLRAGRLALHRRRAGLDAATLRQEVLA